MRTMERTLVAINGMEEISQHLMVVKRRIQGIAQTGKFLRQARTEHTKRTAFLECTDIAICGNDCVRQLTSKLNVPS